jgi:ketosteroid isomerase-like protein
MFELRAGRPPSASWDDRAVSGLTNAELVVAAQEAFNAGDIDTTMTFQAPDVEVIPDPEFPHPPIRGHDALRSLLEEVVETIGGRFEIAEVRAVGADQVLLRGRWGGQGVTSGVEIFADTTVLYTVRDGLIARSEFYLDHDAALKAVGLEE